MIDRFRACCRSSDPEVRDFVAGVLSANWSPNPYNLYGRGHLATAGDVIEIVRAAFGQRAAAKCRIVFH